MKEIFKNYSFAIFYFSFIIFCIALVFIMNERDKKINERVYNNIMYGECAFVDNAIVQYNDKNSHKTLYKIIYKENNKIKEANLSIQQYYNIIEKFKKTVDK